MPLYKYRALDENDCIVESSIKCAEYSDAKRSIIEKGFTPIKIEEYQGIENININLFDKMKMQDIIIFCRELAIVIKSGISLTVGLDILKKQASDKLKGTVQQISIEMQKGRTLSQSMKDREYKFPPLLLRMISAGQASGNLDVVLDNMADYYEKENYIVQKIRNASIYPAILITVAIGLLVFFTQFILPTMEELLTGQSLPFITQFIIGLAKSIASIYSLVAAIIVVAGVIVARKLTADEVYLKYRDRLLLKLPIVGDLIRNIVTVRFTRTLYLLFKSGIDIVNIMDILKKVVSNSVAEECIEVALEGIQRGEKLGVMLDKAGFFDPLVVQMINVGEETGELEKILQEVTEFYERRLNVKIEKVVSMLEPIFTLVIGLGIATIIVAMALPIFNMVGSLDAGGFGGIE